VKVHHLNCGSMNLPTAPLVCHVLLIETDNGLVLVDTGFGLRDCADPGTRLGPLRHIIRPVLQRDETAAHQVEALGFQREEVRHIIVTHLDLDHIGGLADFPHAQIHLTAAEASGAIHSPSWREKIRFRATQWAHGPRLTEHTADGERWRGFAAAKELDDVAAGIALISLPGHTRGHACVAVDAGHRWVLHSGDAFYHPSILDGRSREPRVLTVQENFVAFNRDQMKDNHARLAELFRRGEPDLLIVNSHDPSLFRQARASA
jgi:glyoxylase-like metal-dependent hydrolase (beta-lactamase superfamily II)